MLDFIIASQKNWFFTKTTTYHNAKIFRTLPNDINVEDYEILYDCWVIADNNLYPNVFICKSKSKIDHELLISETKKIIEFLSPEMISVLKSESFVLPSCEKIGYNSDVEMPEMPEFSLNENMLSTLSSFDKKFISYFDKFIPLIKENQSEFLTRIQPSINLWKSFAYVEMKKIMENANLYTPEKISKCVYLSIDIINEYNNYKFDWNLVTENPSIKDRDILLNPDLPWNFHSLDVGNASDRKIPISFFLYKSWKIQGKHKKEVTFNNSEIMFSPGEINPDVLKVKDIDENDVKEAYELLLTDFSEDFEDFPQEFEDTSNPSAESLKEKIRKMILKTGVFLIDEFELSNKDIDYHWFKNLSLEKIVSNLFEKNLDNEEIKILESKYAAELGIRIDFPIKDRNDFLAYLQYLRETKNYRPIILTKCIFFEIDDYLEFKDVFDAIFDINNRDELSGGYNSNFYENNKSTNDRVDKNKNKEYLLLSGKITIEFIRKTIDIFDWNLSELILYLPNKEIFEKILFWQQRIKYLPELITNFDFMISRQSFDSSNILEKLNYIDEQLINKFLFFCPNKKDQYKYLMDFPEIFIQSLLKKDKKYDYIYSSLPSHLLKELNIKNVGKINFNIFDEIFEYSFLETCDLLNYDVYFKIYNQFEKSSSKILLKNEFESLNDEDKFSKYITFIKKNELAKEELSYLIPDDIKRKTKLVKFSTPYQINIAQFFYFFQNEYTGEKNTLDFILVISTSLYRDIYSLFYKYIEIYVVESLKDENVNRVKIYDDLCAYFINLMKHLDEDNSAIKNELIQKFKDIAENFSIYDISKSTFESPNVLFPNESDYGYF